MVFAGAHVVLISIVLKKDQTRNALEHRALASKPFDPGEDHHPVVALIVDRGEKWPEIQLLLLAQAKDDAVVAMLPHGFVQTVQYDALFIHHQ